MPGFIGQFGIQAGFAGFRLGVQTAQNINKAIAKLDDREREVVKRYFGIGAETNTMAEIGGAMGLKRERVRQIRNKAIRKLRKALL